MKRMVGPIVLSLGVTTLAACGGGGGGNGSLSADARQYNSLVDEYNGYLRKYRANGIPLSDVERTPSRQIPVNGKAKYSGVARVDVVDINVVPTGRESSALGTAQLDANFRNRTLTGKATNFKSNKGRAVAGKLNVDSTILGNYILGRTSGSIALDGKTHAINHRNAGIFVGKNAKGVMVSSTDKTTSISRPFDDSYIETSIIAEKK